MDNIKPEWYGPFEAVHHDGVSSFVKRKSNFSCHSDMICICYDNEFGNADETAEMIASLLNKWMENLNTQRANIIIDNWHKLFGMEVRI